jgi:hypothetical protein
MHPRVDLTYTNGPHSHLLAVRPALSSEDIPVGRVVDGSTSDLLTVLFLIALGSLQQHLDTLGDAVPTIESLLLLLVLSPKLAMIFEGSKLRHARRGTDCVLWVATHLVAP